MPSLEDDYPRYLASKRSVDDRAVNERVLRQLATELEGRTRLDVLVLGGGIGRGLERLLEREVLPVNADIACTLVDLRESNVEAARERLPEWAGSQGHTVTELGENHGRPADLDTGTAEGKSGQEERGPHLRIEAGSRTVDVEVLLADAFSVVERGEWDLLVGGAFLDLFDLSEALPRLLRALAPGGYCYFPITFDGGTIFEPAIEGLAPDRLENAFHAHIDDGGDSRAGRHLLTRLPREGSSVLAAGSSDWVVRARDGAYPAEEARFLRYIVDTVADALTENEETDLGEGILARWRERRHEQIERGELLYIAHQLDVLGQVEEADGTGSKSG
ncbi:class I SAM-dependent methyltransferase [Halobacteriales archaeon QS_3_64_16]|nr:MAG: class I SAM-dependent methyltransferase [Halobacteriales archaeon QS_3_64_16]